MILCEARNTEGNPIRLVFGATFSWQSFTLEGLPRRVKSLEKKRHSLASAVSAWNVSIQDKEQAITVHSVSQRLRALVEQARKSE